MEFATWSRKRRSCVMTMQVTFRLQQLLERLDAFDVEMVGGLIEQHQVRIHRERQRERGALALATGDRSGRGVRIHRESLQEFVEPRFARPLRAVVVHAGEIAAQHQRLAQGFRGWQHRFLFHARDAQARAALYFASVERDLAEQRAQQG